MFEKIKSFHTFVCETLKMQLYIHTVIKPASVSTHWCVVTLFFKDVQIKINNKINMLTRGGFTAAETPHASSCSIL